MFKKVGHIPFKVLAVSSAFEEQHGAFYCNQDFFTQINGLESFEEKLARSEALGFKRRFRVLESVNSADLMASALNKAMSEAELSNDQIDFIITVTTTSPKYTTSTAPIVAEKCGLSCPGFEMKTGCASSLYALATAGKLIGEGIKNIAVVFGETLSKTIDKSNPLGFAVGDGGAAVILGQSDQGCGIESGGFAMDGAHNAKMGYGGNLPPNRLDFENRVYEMTYDPSLKDVIDNSWMQLGSFLKANGLTEEIDAVLLHEANNRSTQPIIPYINAQERSVSVLADYGNCGPVSIVLGLERVFKERKANNVLMAAVGGGIALGGLKLNL